MAINIIIMRHGAYDNLLNLSDKGKAQVAKTAQALKPYLQGVVHIYASPQARAIQTAQQLCHDLNIPIYQEWDLLDESLYESFRIRWMENFPAVLAEHCVQCETLILVSHSMTMEWIAHQVNALMGTTFRTMVADMAEAFVLDVVNNAVESVK